MSETLPRVVLFIEDDPVIRTLLCAILHDWAGGGRKCFTLNDLDAALYAITHEAPDEFLCVEVDTIEAALPILATGCVDLVVFDYRINGTPSISNVRTLMDAMPEHQPKAELVVISGDITDQEGLAAMQAGATDYLQKGVGINHHFLVMVRKAWIHRLKHLAHYAHLTQPYGDEPPGVADGTE